MSATPLVLVLVVLEIRSGVDGGPTGVYPGPLRRPKQCIPAAPQPSFCRRDGPCCPAGNTGAASGIYRIDGRCPGKATREGDPVRMKRDGGLWVGNRSACSSARG